ncbi:MAG: ABC transporter ATP-binding protein [Parcubacteria group bacterium]|nr:ABC transporter ATP-binding protein [Parcubacteria group bacterium]
MEIELQKKSLFALPKEVIKNWTRVKNIIWHEKKNTILALLFITLSTSAMGFLQSGTQGLLVNELIKTAGTNLLNPYLIGLIFISILSTLAPSFLYTIQDYFQRSFRLYLEEKFDVLIIKKKGELDVATHENPTQKDLFNKVTEEMWRLRNFVDRQFYIISGIVEVAIASIILLFAQWWIFLIVLVGTIPELIAETRYGERVWSIHSKRSEERRKYWELQNHFNSLPSLIELKLFQNTYYFLSIIKDLFKGFRKEEDKNERIRLRNELLVLILSQCVMAFALIYFVLEIVKGHLLIGTMLFLFGSVGSLRRSLSGLFSNLGRQYQDSLFLSDAFAFLDIKPVLQKPEKGVMLSPHETPEIIFDHVSFAYPGTEKQVLKDFSLRIAPGEKLAIIGINGAGKTTFVKLLCRFYDPQEGKILINGHDLKTIDLESWYYQLGAIFQDYARYHFLVKETISAGRTSDTLSLERVKKAAQSSEADAFIDAWEQKYEQMLGKDFTGGVEPSIGQWQKLALARTFYRNPSILILDEPTSSIDAEAEAKIFEKLEQLPKDKTVILISHRFSTVRQADTIAVIEEGMLRELGTHEKLVKKRGGIYARLFKLQAKGYK